MKLVFLNPAGAWALLGVPALVIIHCLRVRAREIRIPAVFLVKKLHEAAPGSKFARWRGSPLFWVQLLAILLLAFLLCSPRFLAADSRREVALVVDATVSMRAFREESLAAAARLADRVSRDAATTHWLLMSTDAGAPPLYVGEDRAAMLRALDAFKPALGDHDFTDSLLAARRGVAKGGRVVLLTDRAPAEVPGGAELVACGKSKDNVGFSGGVFPDRTRWRALVVNHADTPTVRRWFVETPDGQKSPDKELRLEARGTATLEGAAPGAAFTVVLEGDAFAPDDRLPLVLPVAKPLAWRLSAPESLARIVAPALAALDNAAPAATAAVADLDLVCATTRDLPKGASGARILFLDSEGEETKPSPAPCFAPSPHPLTDGLAWGLVPSLGARSFVPRPGDVVLVRSGERALVWIGHNGKTSELVFNYDPRAVFAGEKIPAVAVLVRRFAETVRAAKDAPEALNTDCRAPLPTPPGDAPLALGDAAGKKTPVAAGATLRAPGEPGFFSVYRGESAKITGAAAFSDTREADLTRCDSAERLLSADEALSRGESTLDPLTVAGALALLALLLVSWRLAASRHAE